QLDARRTVRAPAEAPHRKTRNRVQTIRGFCQGTRGSLILLDYSPCHVLNCTSTVSRSATGWSAGWSSAIIVVAPGYIPACSIDGSIEMKMPDRRTKRARDA